MIKIERFEKVSKLKSGIKDMSAAGNIRETRFENARLAALGIELMRLTELRGKARSQRMNQPERIDFFMLLLVTSGQGSHTVDFVDWPLAAGVLLFVRPGQVQQWHLEDSVEALLILIDPAALPHCSGSVLPREVELLALDEWRTHYVLEKKIRQEINKDFIRLKHDHDHFDAGNLDVSLIRHELLTLLLRLAKLQRAQSANAGASRTNSSVHRMFLKELDASFQKQRSVQYYAHRLGCVASTLSRACLNAEGHSGKQVIDRRVALEAQRMLAHSTGSIADIAIYLGYSEPTNFVKFFRRTVGETPSAFRLRMTVSAQS